MARKHEWLRARLDNWARWVVEGSSGGLGYASQSTFMRFMPVARSAEPRIPIDDISAEQTNSAMERLEAINRSWWAALQCVYIGNPNLPFGRRRPLGHQEIGDLFGVTDRAVRNWLSNGMDQLASMLMRPSGSRGPNYPDS